MSKVDVSYLRELSNSLLIDMSEEDYKVLLKDFDFVLEQMDLIGNINGIDEVEEMFFPYTTKTTSMREDEPINYSNDNILSNVSDTLDNQVKLPKVVK